MFAVLYEAKRREDTERIETAKVDPSIDLWAGMDASPRRPTHH